MQVRTPNFDGNTGCYLFSQRHIPCWFFHRKPCCGDDKNVMLCQIGGDSWSERGFSQLHLSQEKHNHFSWLSWSILPWNSSLAEKVCLGWRCTQKVPYCYRWTERPLTQRDGDFCDQRCYDLCGDSPEKIKKEKSGEDTRSSCLGILDDIVLWGTNLSK